MTFSKVDKESDPVVLAEKANRKKVHARKETVAAAAAAKKKEKEKAQDDVVAPVLPVPA